MQHNNHKHIALLHLRNVSVYLEIFIQFYEIPFIQMFNATFLFFLQINHHGLESNLGLLKLCAIHDIKLTVSIGQMSVYSMPEANEGGLLIQFSFRRSRFGEKFAQCCIQSFGIPLFKIRFDAFLD